MRALVLLLLPILCFAHESDEEALALRRIADFWQEGEYQIAKSQIEDYLKEFPESPYSDTFAAALGDLYLREKNYTQSIGFYSSIHSKEWVDRVFLNRMQSLYHLEWYATLADECEDFLARETETSHRLEATYYLAISLYQQCLNATKNPEQLEKLALRAKPHFTSLLESELSGEVSEAFAHLCCILKDFPRASELYAQLAEKNKEDWEDLLFQSAILQAEYDKEKASQTFSEIAKYGSKRAQEATFNRLVLHFELGHHDQLVDSKETLFSQIPLDKASDVHLFLGRSYLALKKFEQAIQEFTAYLDLEPSLDMKRTALIHLLEASRQASDLSSYEKAICLLTKDFSEDPELPKALFGRAMMLKKEGQWDGAKESLNQLLQNYPQSPQISLAAFEMTHLLHQTQDWANCRSRAHFFISQFPTHELAPFVWKYFASSSAHLAAQEELGHVDIKWQLTEDLEHLLAHPDYLTIAECNDWKFLLSKTYYELGQSDRAVFHLESLLNSSFAQEGNARLLMALLKRSHSTELFCQLAEEALALQADLIPPAQVHTSLYNTYLEQSLTEPIIVKKAADHLFTAFTLNGMLQEDNLLWLADYYFQTAEDESMAADRAITILEKCPKSSSSLYKLAKLYSLQNRTEEQIAILEPYRSELTPETQLLLAEAYAKKNQTEKAIELFDAILGASSTIRHPIAASACLQGIRLKQTLGQPAANTAIVLKNLIIQRNFLNEPIHLEGALDYIDLQAGNNLQKRLDLLEKTKSDFESSDDLLAKDYQEARKQFPQKEEIYQDYISFFEADICLCKASFTSEPDEQKQLQAKAKALLLQIKAPPLASRIRDRLDGLTIDEKS